MVGSPGTVISLSKADLFSVEAQPNQREKLENLTMLKFHFRVHQYFSLPYGRLTPLSP